MKTMATGQVHGCFVLAHATEAPTEPEWDRYIEQMRAYIPQVPRLRILVVTEGGTPSPKQRQALDVVSKPVMNKSKIAVVTRSTFARGVVNAFALLYPVYRAFDPRDIDGALRYLDLSPAQMDDAKRRIDELRAELALRPIA